MPPKKLVDSIVRPTPTPRSPWSEKDLRRIEPSDFKSIRGQLVGPFVGLFLTGLMALITSVVFGVVNIQESSGDKFVSLLALPVALGAGFVLVAAVRMFRLRSYLMAVMASALALIPWSPGWILGLPFGIWALIVLSKPEVMAAFLGDRGDVGFRLPQAQPVSARNPGRFRVFFQSVGRYCFTRFSGRQAGLNQAGAEVMPKPEAPIEQPRPHQPVTVDYTPEPDNPKLNLPDK